MFLEAVGDTIYFSVGTNLYRIPAAALAANAPNGSANTTPVAANDTFNAPSAILSMPDAMLGPLRNDTDADADAFYSTLVNPPTKGSLIFNYNGTFEYSPRNGFDGTDSFTYNINDGYGASTATVALTGPVLPDNSGFTNAQFNFQSGTTNTPVGWLNDNGTTRSATRGGFYYGWDTTQTATNRITPMATDFTLRSYVSLGTSAKWQFSLPNGTTAQYGQVADNGLLDATNKLSISLWVKPTNLNSSNPHFLVSKRVGANDQQAYSLYFHTDKKLLVNLDGNGNSFSSNTVFQNNLWYHIALVYDGTAPTAERARIYVNGVLDVVASETSATLPNSPAALFVGLSNSGDTRYTPAWLDDLRIYRSTLDANQIANLANKTPPLSLYAAWSADLANFPAGTPEADRLTSADPDRDDVVNLLEYALDLPPMASQSGGLPTLATTGATVSLTYLRARPDVTYTVERSTALATWTNSGVTQATTPVGQNASATTPYDPLNENHLFLRLSVTQP